MTRQTIETFLREKRLVPYCDECIRAEIGETDIATVAEETKDMRNDLGFLGGCEYCTLRRLRVVRPACALAPAAASGHGGTLRSSTLMILEYELSPSPVLDLEPETIFLSGR